MTYPRTQLVQRRITEDQILARASRDLTRRGHRHPDWFAGDPHNCAGCALAIELADQDCAAPGHECTPACWQDMRCPDHIGGAP